MIDVWPRVLRTSRPMSRWSCSDDWSAREVLRRVAAIARKSTDVAISGHRHGRRRELLFSDSMNMPQHSVRTPRSISPPDKVLASLAGFTELSSGISRNWASGAMANGDQRSPRTVPRWRRSWKSSSAGRKEILARCRSQGLCLCEATRGLDLSRPIDPDRLARATRYPSDCV